jgi:hypothetical protein
MSYCCVVLHIISRDELLLCRVAHHLANFSHTPILVLVAMHHEIPLLPCCWVHSIRLSLTAFLLQGQTKISHWFVPDICPPYVPVAQDSTNHDDACFRVCLTNKGMSITGALGEIIIYQKRNPYMLWRFIPHMLSFHICASFKQKNHYAKRNPIETGSSISR